MEVLLVPNGEWSFIHEWMLYEYMINKFNEGTLRLKLIVSNGKLNLKTKYVKVKRLMNISNTDFPDIDGIEFEGDKSIRVAEVKFMTSKFKYHLKNYDRSNKYSYNDFLKDNGCIIVLAHDEMPRKLNDKIDVFEIEQDDFISYIRENLTRLINRQMHKSTYNKIWVMYQGPNFNKGSEYVKPARESGIWCPSDNLTGFELGVGDTVLFIKTKGSRTQDLELKYNQWLLDSIFTSKITLSIASREHYCQMKGISEDSLLWYDETDKGKKDSKLRQRKTKEKFRWNRVFEFKKEEEFSDLNLLIKDIPHNLEHFKNACKDVFLNPTSIEISVDEYLYLFQYITKKYTN